MLAPVLHARPARLSTIATAAMLATLMLGACVPAQRMELSFDANEHAPYMRSGNASIEGQGFIRKNNGQLVRCSGGEITLAPATPYFREMVEIARKGAPVMDGTALRKAHAGAVRKAQCDIDGNFTFTNLPAGKWFLQTRIIWHTAQGIQGGWLVREVETPASGVLKTLIADQNLIS